MLLYQLPALLVCTAAVVVIFAKWKLSPSASLLALLGFGLLIFMSIIMPVVHTALQYGLIHNSGNGSMAGRAWIISAVSIIWAVVHAVALLLLLAAVYSGRKTIN